MLRSLRAKFGVTATAGLLVVLVMTCLLIVLANRNERIVKTAQETQHSIAGLFQVQTALYRYQAETLAEVREGPMNPSRYPAVRADFIAAATAIRVPLPVPARFRRKPPSGFSSNRCASSNDTTSTSR